MLSGVCPLPSSHMVESLVGDYSCFYTRKQRSCVSLSFYFCCIIIHEKSFLLLSPNCSTRFFWGGFEVDLSRRRVSDRKVGTSSDLWHTRETQEVVGGGGAEGRGGNYNQANSTLILPCILSLCEELCRSRLPKLSQNLHKLLLTRNRFDIFYYTQSGV